MEAHYRSKWYVRRGAAPMAFGVGVFGQNVFVDPENGIVIAKLSSQAPPSTSASSPSPCAAPRHSVATSRGAEAGTRFALAATYPDDQPFLACGLTRGPSISSRA